KPSGAVADRHTDKDRSRAEWPGPGQLICLPATSPPSTCAACLRSITAPPPSQQGSCAVDRGDVVALAAMTKHRSWRNPLFENRRQRLLLRLVDLLAALPRHGLDQILDCLFDAVAKIVWVHRIKFPTTVSVIGAEPFVARVLALIRCWERRQFAYV